MKILSIKTGFLRRYEVWNGYDPEKDNFRRFITLTIWSYYFYLIEPQFLICQNVVVARYIKNFTQKHKIHIPEVITNVISEYYCIDLMIFKDGNQKFKRSICKLPIHFENYHNH